MPEGTARRQVVNPLEDPTAQRIRIPQSRRTAIRPVQVAGLDRELKQLDSVFGGLSDTFAQWQTDLNNQATLAGEMLHQAGASVEQAQASGNKHTVAGFKAMQREAGAHQWFQQQVSDIEEKNHTLSPEEYAEELHKSYRGMQAQLGSDPAGKAELHEMSKKFFPELITKHVEKHTEWSGEQNSTQYSNVLISAAASGDTKRVSELLGSNPGLTPDRWRSSITDALTASLDADDTSIMDMLQGEGVMARLGFTPREQEKITKAQRAYENRQQDAYDSSVTAGLLNARLKLQQGGSIQEFEQTVLGIAAAKDKPDKWVQMIMNKGMNTHLANAKKAISDAEGVVKERTTSIIMSPQFQTEIQKILVAQMTGELGGEQAQIAIQELAKQAGVPVRAVDGYSKSVRSTERRLINDQIKAGQADAKKAVILQEKRTAGKRAAINRSGLPKDEAGKAAYLEESFKQAIEVVQADPAIAEDQKVNAAQRVYTQRLLNDDIVPPELQQKLTALGRIGLPGEADASEEQFMDAMKWGLYVKDIAGDAGVSKVMSDKEAMVFRQVQKMDIHDQSDTQDALSAARAVVGRWTENAEVDKLPDATVENIQDFIEDSDIGGDPGSLPFAAEASVYSTALKNNPYLINDVQEEFLRQRALTPGADKEALMEQAVNNVRNDGSFVLGNYMSKGGKPNYYEDTYGSVNIRTDEDLNAAVVDFLADKGPETWKGFYNSFEISSPWDSLVDKARVAEGGVPPMHVVIDPLSGVMQVDVFKDKNYTERLGRPIFIDPKAIGQHYDDVLLAPPEDSVFDIFPTKGAR